MKVTHAGRQITVNVRADGDGLVSHAGSALLAQVADKTGLTRALNVAVGEPGLRAGSHDRGRVIRDLAVMLADGGDCLADLRAVGDQAALFGPTASPSTAFRVIDRIASTPGLLGALGDAHARARARVWELVGAPERLTIDLDATLITAHSEKDGAAGTFKGGYGFAPMLAYGDETGEALAGELRPGNAGANNAIDQIQVAEQAVAQIPAAHIETIEIVLRVDSAGASHELIDWCRERQIEYSVGYDLTETVRAAILQIPERRLGVLTGSGRAAAPERAGLRDHRAPRPGQLAAGHAGDRPARARAPRRATVVHRPRRAPLPSHPHRPDRPGRRARA